MEETKDRENLNIINGFSKVTSSTPIFWKSRKRSADQILEGVEVVVSKRKLRQLIPHVNWNIAPLRAMNSSCSHLVIDPQAASMKNMNKPVDDPTADKLLEKRQSPPAPDVSDANKSMEQEESKLSNNFSVLSEKRKALFEPLEPVINVNGKRPSAESLLPPPDFESASYPQGWLIGKKRKLVNVDVVESMRRIAVQEMNRKDREIDGLNEQLEEDARCLEHLQLQLLEERSKRTDAERQNTMLQNQITMLVNMLEENEGMEDEGTHQAP